MDTRSLPALQVVVAAVVTVVVGLFTDNGWPGYLTGAILALALWVMLMAGNLGRSPRPDPLVPLVLYAGTAVVAIVLGLVFFQVGDGPVWWSPGFILAGVAAPFAFTALQDRGGA